MISVIIPVYNAEKYIAECLDSVLSQTYARLEVIAVDDGSPDNSGKILDEYAARDRRIKVLHCDNAGPSTARNRGLRAAEGSYICFVDNDDILAPDYIEKLLSPIRGKKRAFSFCDYSSDYPLEQKEGITEPVSRDRFKGFLSDLKSPEYIVAVVVWNKLYTRDIWDGLFFPDGKLPDDEAVIYDVIIGSKEIYYVQTPLYYYRRHEGSITADIKKLERTGLYAISTYEDRAEKALKQNDREFAEICIRNSLYRLTELSEEIGSRDKEAKKHIAAEYKRIYKKYSRYLNIKRRLKYKVLSIKL